MGNSVINQPGIGPSNCWGPQQCQGPYHQVSKNGRIFMRPKNCDKWFIRNHSNFQTIMMFGVVCFMFVFVKKNNSLTLQPVGTLSVFLSRQESARFFQVAKLWVIIWHRTPKCTIARKIFQNYHIFASSLIPLNWVPFNEPCKTLESCWTF